MSGRKARTSSQSSGHIVGVDLQACLDADRSPMAAATASHLDLVRLASIASVKDGIGGDFLGDERSDASGTDN